MIETKPHILVVDDDLRLRQLLTRYLEKEHYTITEAASAEEADEIMKLFTFDLIILDIMLPQKDGLTFIQDMRKWSHTPVLLLTARGKTEDRIEGLELGADDYLAKPFEPRELLLRLQNILKHQQNKPNAALPTNQMIYFGPYAFDTKEERLWYISNDQKEAVNLTAIEIKILQLLVKNTLFPLSREAIARGCDIEGNMRNIDVYITRLRKKIEHDAKNPDYIQTIRNQGYILRNVRSL